MAAASHAQTGANKGIGYEIVRQLSAQGVTAVLTGRSNALVQRAADALSAELGRPVPRRQLDVADAASVDAAAAWLADEYGAAVTILVNNAGIAYKGNTFGAEEARTTIETNVYGTIRVTERRVPAPPAAAASGYPRPQSAPPQPLAAATARRAAAGCCRCCARSRSRRTERAS